MQGILENLPVAAMMLLMQWPLFAAAAVIMLASLVVCAVRGNWFAARRWKMGAVGFMITLPFAAAIAFLLFGGRPEDLRYQMDWLFLGAFCSAAGLFVAAVSYLVARPH